MTRALAQHPIPTARHAVRHMLRSPNQHVQDTSAKARHPQQKMLCVMMRLDNYILKQNPILPCSVAVKYARHLS